MLQKLVSSLAYLEVNFLDVLDELVAGYLVNGL